MRKIINRDRSIIPACDADLDIYEKIVQETADIDGVGGYKIGFFLGLKYGLPKIVDIAREYTDKPIIYDHQKAGTDIPDTGGKFAEVCKDAGVDAVIFFPQAGPETEKAWIESAHEEGLGVIVGGEMTHKGYKKSEGGYIDDGALDEIYTNAANLGVTDFVVPGNRLERISHYKDILKSRGIEPIFYAPGFVAQGGKITDAAEVSGEYWHAIVGRGIYESDNIRKSALELTSQL